MPGTPDPHRAPAPAVPPDRCDKGLANSDPVELDAHVAAAWDAFLHVARSADLDAPSRLPGWTGADVCIHLGAWEEGGALPQVVASARAGGAGATPSPDEDNARSIAEHRGASRAELLAALERARDRVTGFLRSEERVAVGWLPAASPVGPLPVLTQVQAASYELAVHALDLAPCGAHVPAPVLLDRGLASLIDVTGALAARAQLDIAVTAQTPGGGWSFCAHDGGWRTEAVPAGKYDGTGVSGPAALLLDISAGRQQPLTQLVARRIVLQHAPSFLRLAPLLDSAPGVPGGTALRAAAAALSGAGRLAGRLPRLPRLR